jgi:serine O-acetyltransferase
MFQRLREDIATVMDKDPAAKSRLEVLLFYPGVHAIVLHRWAQRFRRAGMHSLARGCSHFARGITGIEIHPGATVGRRVFIDHGMGVVIGETAEIGDDCTIYQGVTLGGTSLHQGKRHPTLARGVVVGAGAKVLGPFTVGSGARIGSNSVVVKEVPAGATAVGIPARIILNDEAKRREEQANKMGFSAYAVTQSADDPLTIALTQLIAHAAEQDKKIEELRAALCRAIGPTLEPCSEIDRDGLTKLVN